MSPITIAIAGFTGKLATLITSALLARHPDVTIHGLARSPQKVDPKIASSPQVKIFTASAMDTDAIRDAVRGADICICCYLGDDALMIDGQKILIDACIAEQVPRYMASDWSLDYRGLALGDHPIKDPMKRIQAYLEEKEAEGKIRAVHVLNGVFMDVVVSPFSPWFNSQRAIFSYYGTGEEPVEMTTMADAAAYTAEVAVDPGLVGFFNFLSDSKSVKQMADVYEKAFGTAPHVECLGSLEDLRAVKDRVRQEQPHKIYAWMGLFYLYFMTRGTTNLGPLDNGRFPFIKPKSFEEILKESGQKDK